MQGPDLFQKIGSPVLKEFSTVFKESSAAIKEVGIPARDLWEVILGRKVELDLYEDNQAASQIVKTGKSQKLRHVPFHTCSYSAALVG